MSRRPRPNEQQREPGLSAPLQMCDALSHKVPKLSEGVEILVANLWHMEGTSLWKWFRAFPKSAAMLTNQNPIIMPAS
jgi:hypothetical protein